MILWLEDREDTVRSPRVALLQAGLQFEMLPSPRSFKQYLEEELASGSRPFAFLVDLMLYGIPDLKSINIPNAPTLSGNHAGFVFADRYLRGPDFQWNTVPICFLTERQIETSLHDDVAYLASRGPGPVEILQKYKQSDSLRLVELMTKWRGRA